MHSNPPKMLSEILSEAQYKALLGEQTPGLRRTEPKDRNAIAYDLLPICIECHDAADASAIAFQLADDFLAIAQQTQELPEIKISLGDYLWNIDELQGDELALSRLNDDQNGYEYLYLKLEAFWNAFGKALRRKP